jgi:transcriptional regulator with XRE-family HTH domain
MRSKILQEILDETPKDVEIFVRLYADIVVRINQVLAEKGMSQKDFAESMGKKQSEISKWLSGNHNFTLRSLAKVMAELDEVILYVPKQHIFKGSMDSKVIMTVHKNRGIHIPKNFNKFKLIPQNLEHASAS